MINNVVLMGRLTADPELRTTASGISTSRFTIAVDRAYAKNGEDRQADFISCVAFGKSAEFIEKYFNKGKGIALTGRIQTGSYDKNGQKIYTTDVVADRVEFVPGGSGDGSSSFNNGGSRQAAPMENNNSAPDGFNLMTEDDIPF